MEIVMALVDFIPVILCFLAMFKMQKILYHQMSKYAFAMFAAGSIMILFAGSCKAVWKLLYFAANFDFAALNTLMFPVQAFGFMFAFIGLIIMFVDFKNDSKKALCLALPLLFLAAPVPYTSNIPFLPFQIIGTFGIYGVISWLGFKKKKPIIGIVMILACVLMLAMGYLSTKTTNPDGTVNVLFNWIAEGINIAAQGMFMICTYRVAKLGVDDIKALTK